jgi:hypothetical protein
MVETQIALAVIAAAIFTTLVWIVLKGSKDEELRRVRETSRGRERVIGFPKLSSVKSVIGRSRKLIALCGLHL